MAEWTPMAWMKSFEEWLHFAVFYKFHRNCIHGDKPFFDPHLLGATADLEAGYPEIRAEVDKLMQRYEELTPFQTMSPDQEYISDDDRWKFFFLKCAGIRFRKNIALMPKTMEIIGRHKQIVSAYLSILAPHKSLPPHQGPWAGGLRAARLGGRRGWIVGGRSGADRSGALGGTAVLLADARPHSSTHQLRSRLEV